VDPALRQAQGKVYTAVTTTAIFISLGAFAQGGYKGFTSAEYESEEDPKTGAPKLLAKIKMLNKKYSTV
jgi:hypothetical protein